MRNLEPIDREEWIAELLKDKEKTYEALKNSPALKRRREKAARARAKQKQTVPLENDSQGKDEQ
ncbi:hypothetical protein GCM10010967_41460 [Dyadobacter beijingensis]|uniref:Uncharacterized protein n=1 Tax=Dyadobacter beijingensis TaxID=365489 RepID=A0ABQ2I9G5_9BACT|nr:hypothetical protein [Dyadobacter beijingensis]GGN02507.1 hypothetical protein GCM10010967_41460 [Dyadobacter beijingensis]